MQALSRLLATAPKSPTSAMLELADLLEEEIKSLVAAAHVPIGWGKYESHIEALLQLNLIIRHVEAVAVLARLDVTLLPSAMVLARAAAETSVKLQWMLRPGEPFERERRWLVQLDRLADFYGKIDKRPGGRGVAGLPPVPTQAEVKAAADAIRRLLPKKKYAPLKGLPTVEGILKELGNPADYALYQRASEFVHGTQEGTSFYWRHFGVAREVGEFMTPADWRVCFGACWDSLERAGKLWLKRNGRSAASFAPVGLRARKDAALDRLKAEDNRPIGT